jgi:hypothetical protein
MRSLFGSSAKYIIEEHADGTADVIHLGPYTVAEGLRFKEALALAQELNKEARARCAK